MIIIQYHWKGVCEYEYRIGCYELMYHIVPEVRFSIYITVQWVCHSVVWLVSSNGYILFPRP